MSYKIGVLSFCILIGVASCYHKDELQPEYDLSTPYEKSFWGKDIYYVLRKDPIDNIDTIKLDRYGNIIEEQWHGHGYVLRRFNSNHRLLQILDYGEPENLLMSYDSGANWLIQNRNSLNRLAWGVDSLTFDPSRSFKIIFSFNENGKTQTEFDFFNKTVTEYAYEKGNLIEKITTRMGGPKAKPESVRFFYRDNLIDRIEETYEGGSAPDKILFFNSGRLDSIHQFTFDKTTMVTTFQYVYNE